MDFTTLVNERESCRAFTGAAVDDKKIETILEAMRLAPSATNQQPWRFIVVTNADTRKTMASAMQRFTAKAGAFIVIVEEGRRLAVKGMEKLKRQAWTQYDFGIASAHGALAATELGLGSCIIGWFKERKIADAINVSKANRIRLILAIGEKEDPTPRPKKRKSMEDVARWIR